MKRVGIVCEFNPFHNGHRFLLRTLRDAGAEEIVCVMSDSFVQRGEPCVLPARDRAETAVRSGADAVLTLPFPWSCASAEFFAGAGMALCRRLGCDTVAFGSESADFARLSAAASADVPKAGGAEGTAAVYARLDPNDILASAYIRACRRLGYTPDFYPVARVGAGHGDASASAEASSSSAARRSLREGILPENLPAAARTVLRRAEEAGVCPTDIRRFSDVLWAHWRVCDAQEAAACAECGGGVAARLSAAAGKASCGEEMFRLAATKKYTDARLRRAALYGYLRISADLLHAFPAYTRLLACNEKGREVLRTLSPEPGFVVVSNVRSIPDFPSAAEQNAAEKRAEAFLTLLCPAAPAAGTFYKSSPLLLAESTNRD